MEQNPEYLRNQSRSLHDLYRRNRRFLNGFILVWIALFTVLLIAGATDRLLGLGWGYTSKDLWTYVAFIGFAGVFWIFARLILKINLRYVRHTYGPEH